MTEISRPTGGTMCRYLVRIYIYTHYSYTYRALAAAVTATRAGGLAAAAEQQMTKSS